MPSIYERISTECGASLNQLRLCWTAKSFLEQVVTTNKRLSVRCLTFATTIKTRFRLYHITCDNVFRALFTTINSSVVTLHGWGHLTLFL